MDLFVVILNWNAAEDTIQCVKNMDEWQVIQPTIWVVDNNSHDDSVDQIRQRYPSVRLICNKTNLGFSGGSNRGMEAALAEGNAPILLLNNDARIGEDDVIRLGQTLEENRSWGFIMPLLVEAETGELVTVGRKNPVTHLQSAILELPDGDPMVEVEAVSGTAVLVNPEMLRQVGLLDEQFFFSAEIAELCLRANKAGYKCAVDVRASASHSVGSSPSLRSTLYVYYIVRNRFLILRKHYRYHVPLFLFWVAYSLALAGKLLLLGERPSARAAWLASWDGVWGRFGNQNERIMGQGM
ncbi:MAG: glycosyltransferase family 2 protein [Chloroflexi bacterium]|nr:MAG: glycosyltransferase family 2 protein [Chloroflexota bacterium]